MPNKKYDVILFDMDGTVADTDPMIKTAMYVLYDKYRHGVRTPDEQIIYFSGPPIKETLKKEFPDLDQNFIYDEFHRESFKLYQTHVFRYPGSKAVLLDLKQQGFKLGIVTSKIHSLTEYALKCIGLDGIFEYIVAYDDVWHPKPDGEGILKCIDHFKGDKKRTLYIGDNPSDLDTANNAGVDCCLVSWGPRKLDPKLKPAFKIASYLELKEHLYE